MATSSWTTWFDTKDSVLKEFSAAGSNASQSKTYRNKRRNIGRKARPIII